MFKRKDGENGPKTVEYKNQNYSDSKKKKKKRFVVLYHNHHIIGDNVFMVYQADGIPTLMDR